MWFGGDAIMAVVMTLLVIGWLRTSGRSLRDRSSWLEQARAETLRGRTGGEDRPAATSAPALDDLDDDQARLDAYNAWLAGMAKDDGRQARS